LRPPNSSSVALAEAPCGVGAVSARAVVGEVPLRAAATGVEGLAAGRAAIATTCGGATSFRMKGTGATTGLDFGAAVAADGAADATKPTAGRADEAPGDGASGSGAGAGKATSADGGRLAWLAVTELVGGNPRDARTVTMLAATAAKAAAAAGTIHRVGPDAVPSTAGRALAALGLRLEGAGQDGRRGGGGSVRRDGSRDSGRGRAGGALDAGAGLGGVAETVGSARTGSAAAGGSGGAPASACPPNPEASRSQSSATTDDPDLSAKLVSACRCTAMA
jgi:hypothetical protein